MQRPDLDRVSRKVEAYIEHLESRVRRAEQEANAALGVCKPDQRVRLVSLGGNPDRPLPDHAIIRFQVGPSEMDTVDFQIGIEKGSVRACTYPGSHLVIHPRASNTAQLEPKSTHR